METVYGFVKSSDPRGTEKAQNAATPRGTGLSGGYSCKDIKKEKFMSQFISKMLQKSLASALLVSLSFIATVVDCAAQTAIGNKPPTARLRVLGESRTGTRSTRSSLVPASGPMWTLLFPAYSDADLFFATLLSEHSAVYDPSSNTMIVFGGLDQNDVPQNTVLLESNANGSGGLEAGMWSELNPAVVPPPRIFHSAVYDQTNNRMIVFGGCVDLNCDIPLNDTWVLTNANGQGGTPSWIQLAPAGTLPNPRDFH